MCPPVKPSPKPTPPPGCYYQQVQCFRAPCDPILVCPTPTPGATPTATPSPTPTPIPTLTPGTTQTLRFRVKLDGVAADQAQGAKITVKFYRRNGTTRQLSAPLTLRHVGNGIYLAAAAIKNPFPAGTQFRVKIKGEKHIAIEFCRQSGQTGPCADGAYITVPNPVPAVYAFDFTGIPFPAGDLPQQDGRVDGADIQRLTSLLSKLSSDLTAGDLTIGDLNYDDVINGFDIFLIRKTLETRYDE